MRAITKAVAGAVMLLLGSSSFALQFDPAPTARLHTSTQPGAEWNTGGPSAGGSIVYDQGSGTLAVVAALDVLNYYDTASGSVCESNTGSNCTSTTTRTSTSASPPASSTWSCSRSSGRSSR